jgi:hypothetical protein
MIDAGKENRTSDQGAALRSALELFSRLLSYNDTTWLKFESVWLIFQTMIIVFLAFQIADTFNFFVVYAALLVCNSIWLTSTNVLVEHTISDIHQEVFKFYSADRGFLARYPHLASWRWAINNMLHFVLLVGILALHDRALGYRLLGVTIQSEHVGIFGYLVCVSNCVVDLSITRDFYFPKFAKFYDAFQGAIKPPEVWSDGVETKKAMTLPAERP